MILRDLPCGVWIETPAVGILFGNKASSFETLKKQFPALSWARIKQTHSDIVVPAGRSEIPTLEADAHFTNERDLGLLISTADCVPVMLADVDSGWVVAIHAGWRGVARRIVPKAIEQLLQKGSKRESIYSWIGPHIQQASFEVDTPVKDQLLAARGRHSSAADFASARTDGKYLIDLNGVVKSQLQDFDLAADRVFDLHIDTKTDLSYHSYRRDGVLAGRNLSFIILRNAKMTV